MIADKCLTSAWVARQQVAMPTVSDVTIERSIRALVLLERLAASDLRFVFKGGTCMMLHLQDLRRLSVDIDIVCTEGLARITPVLDVIGQGSPFTRWDEDKRNPDRRPKRKHFRFFYDSLDPNNPEPFVLLDVVLEHVPHPFTERKSVAVPFIETIAPPQVIVPTLNGLLGDKLTAFAPETVGIKYRPKLSQQIIKQMFDVGELFQVAADLDEIRQAHEDYIRGFLTFIATDPRVPANVRAEMQQWGLCKDEFQDTGGWPHTMYIREARRMLGAYVMTEKNCRHAETPDDAVGLGAYNMDSHNCRRIVQDGAARNEGDVQVGVKPYPVSYRAIIPRGDECANLWVPVALSATHIAYGSIRMEPVFMILGQSAATAACLAIDDRVAAQNVDYAKLRAQLLKDGQILAWPAK